MLPGIAPINTAKGVIFFNGVYIIVYITIANNPNINELKLILPSRYKPKTPVIMQKVRASGILKTLQGSGLDKVLDINSSVLCSII